jgi:PAS domain S-box-containing protein
MALNILKRKFDPAVAVTIKFLVVGILWFLFSDAFVGGMDQDNFISRMAHVQIVKGVFFVGVTAGVFFLILHRYTYDIKALKRERDYFFRSSPVPMALVDSFSFRFRDANDATLKLLGYSAKELHSLSIQQLIFPEDRAKFESVMLFIKTGFDGLGSWRFRCSDGSALHANISSKAIREQQVFLISFQDIAGQIKAEEEIMQLNQKLMFEVGRHTRQLESKNEELAYRASQTQHINEELILVNEQLLSVNKKIAVERDMAMARSMALEQLTHVTCSFDLTDKTSCLISDNAPELFDDGRLAPNKPWFWLDYVHPEDVALVESSQRKLTSDKESCCLYRIKTKNGETRVVFNHLRILEQEGTNVLVGSFVDVSRFTSESSNAARVHKT